MYAYRFGDWTVEPARCCLARGDVERHLEPKAMDVLVCLLDRPGEVVSIPELMETAWSGRLVEESSVHQRISQIRRAMADSSARPQYVESVPRRGYRTIAPVVAAAEHGRRRHRNGVLAPASAAARASVMPARTWATVAVLPLRDLSPSGAGDWLAQGLTEHLRRQIGMWGRFKVLPHALLVGRSVDDLPPGVDVLLDGHFQVEGDQVTIGLDVIDVARRTHLWSKTFRSPYSGQLELQRQIATHIARLFGESLVLLPAPTQPEAFEPFLHFLAEWSFGSYDDTRFWLERTLERDPDWSLGWAELAGLLLRIGSVMRDLDYREQARRILLERARSDDAQRWFVVYESWLRAYWEGDLSGAEELLRPLAEVGYSWPYAMLMLTSGLYREAEVYYRELTRANPFVNVGWEMLLQARLNLGDGSGAVEAGRSITRLYPPEAFNAPSLLCQALAGAGVVDEAEAVSADLARRAARLSNGPQRRLTEANLQRIRFVLALAQPTSTAARTAADCMARLDRHADACVMYLRLGEEGLAEQSLSRVQPDLDRFWWWGTTTHLTEKTEAHPMVRELRERLGFTGSWRYELAQRASTLPTRSGIRCDARRYKLQSRRGA